MAAKLKNQKAALAKAARFSPGCDIFYVMAVPHYSLKEFGGRRMVILCARYDGPAADELKPGSGNLVRRSATARWPWTTGRVPMSAVNVKACFPTLDEARTNLSERAWKVADEWRVLANGADAVEPEVGGMDGQRFTAPAGLNPTIKDK